MRVLAAIDGSSYSHGVIEAIAVRVWEPGTEIKLVTVMEKHVDYAHLHGGYHRIDDNHSTDDPSQPHKHLIQFSLSLREKVGLQNTSVSIDPVVVVGHAAEEILTLAKNWRADLTVVGTRGCTGLQKLLLGSVSTEVLRHSTSHVQIARSNPKRASGNVYRILVPVDHSPFSQAAVEWLVQHRWQKAVEIQILTVVPEIHQLSEQFTEEENPEKAAIILSKIQSLKAKSLEQLNALADEIQIKTDAISVSCSIKAGEPPAVITGTARDWQADLILMGSHGRTGLNRILLGSVSSEVVQTSHSAVEVVKSQAVQLETFAI